MFSLFFATPARSSRCRAGVLLVLLAGLAALAAAAGPPADEGDDELVMEFNKQLTIQVFLRARVVELLSGQWRMLRGPDRRGARRFMRKAEFLPTLELFDVVSLVLPDHRRVFHAWRRRYAEYSNPELAQGTTGREKRRRRRPRRSRKPRGSAPDSLPQKREGAGKREPPPS